MSRAEEARVEIRRFIGKWEGERWGGEVLIKDGGTRHNPFNFHFLIFGEKNFFSQRAS